MSRSAKVAKIIPLETPDNSSSEDEQEQEELQDQASEETREAVD